MLVVSVVIDPAPATDILAAGVLKFGWLKILKPSKRNRTCPAPPSWGTLNRLKMLASKLIAPGPYRMSRPEFP